LVIFAGSLTIPGKSSPARDKARKPPQNNLATNATIVVATSHGDAHAPSPPYHRRPAQLRPTSMAHRRYPNTHRYPAQRRHGRAPRRIQNPVPKTTRLAPAPDDDSLIQADRIFIKHGYAPSQETIEYLKSLKVDRVLVCGLQTETCCLAAGFSLFDAGLQPTLITDLTMGSSLDRTGELGVRLWKHHFKHTLKSSEL